MWSKAGLLEVLPYIRVLKGEHDELSELPGFLAWTTFVHKHMGDVKDKYLLIKDINNQVIFRLDDTIQECV